MDKSQIESTINEIRKRNDAVTVFSQDKTTNAINKTQMHSIQIFHMKELIN